MLVNISGIFSRNLPDTTPRGRVAVCAMVVCHEGRHGSDNKFNVQVLVKSLSFENRTVFISESESWKIFSILEIETKNNLKSSHQ